MSIRLEGLHLPNAHFLLDGYALPAHLVTLCLYLFHNWRALKAVRWRSAEHHCNSSMLHVLRCRTAQRLRFICRSWRRTRKEAITTRCSKRLKRCSVTRVKAAVFGLIWLLYAESQGYSRGSLAAFVIVENVYWSACAWSELLFSKQLFGCQRVSEGGNRLRPAQLRRWCAFASYFTMQPVSCCQA